MTAVSYVLLILGAIFTTIFVIDKIHKYSVGETILKAFASLCFVALATYHSFLRGASFFSMMVILALVFGLLGDIWLDLKYVYKENSKIYTYAGFICFGLGHVLFIIGMFKQFYIPGNFWYVILPFVFGLLMACCTLLIEKPMKLNYGKMKIIVFVYGLLLFSMFGTAFSLYVLSGFKSLTLLLMSIGGCLFATSDLILSGTYFGNGKERAVDIATNVATYYAAQFIIAFSILAMGIMVF